jgi:hypothetical protein
VCSITRRCALLTSSSALQRAYIILYLAMAVLSLTTVVLSLLGDCPPTSFYVLEVIVNTVMIAEVGIRMVAYGSVRIPHLGPRFWAAS